MRIKFWGTRGAITSPDEAKMAYGGNTCCAEVVSAAGTHLILDGGIGLHWLGKSLLQRGFATGQGISRLLLSRVHWDHIQGIPFCLPMLIAGNRISIYGCGTSSKTLQQLLLQQMASPYCPVPNFFKGDIGACVTVHELDDGPMQVEDIRIEHRRLNDDDDDPVLGFRLESDDGVLTYIPTVEYRREDDRHPALYLAASADLLIHDAYFSPDEYIPGQGHATDADAVQLAKDAGVRRLLCYHYHPDHTDAFIDQRLAAYDGLELNVEGAREGTQYSIGEDSI